MAPVKRPYHAPVRAQQAARTRRRVAQAAVEAFAANGWAGTTIAGIARAAEVTPQAVHLSVGAKPALLIAAVRHAVAGDQPDLPLAEREPFRQAYAPGATVRERALAFAAGTRGFYERPARSSWCSPRPHRSMQDWPDCGSARAGRLADCRRLVRLTGRRSQVADRRLADLIFVQSGPGVHADLVSDRGWTSAAYEAWLAATMEFLLNS